MSRLVSLWRRRVRRWLQPERTALADLRAIFDQGWYGTRYPDGRGMSDEPFAHFLAHGIAEGRVPNRFFDPVWYVARNPEAGGRPPLVHYAVRGRKARLDPGPDFSAASYLAAHRDVARTGMDPLEHYIRYGRREGRQIFRSRHGRGTGNPSGGDEEPDDLDFPLGIDETAQRLATRFHRRGTPIAADR